jgi:uncharacterized peroxidase-related enzyme
VSLDEPLVADLKRDWRTATLSEQDRAILTYAEKLTLHPARVAKEDLEPLRQVGLDDTGILQVNLIASFFNYVTRVADGLGVGRGE